MIARCQDHLPSLAIPHGLVAYLRASATLTELLAVAPWLRQIVLLFELNIRKGVGHEHLFRLSFTTTLLFHLGHDCLLLHNDARISIGLLCLLLQRLKQLLVLSVLLEVVAELLLFLAHLYQLLVSQVGIAHGSACAHSSGALR